ncbi:MHYT domain-containing protein [Geminocystis sp. NIES-3709]|uniref:MHYT domain-containing protein n=1 Tax=Geminocystis sp. NIES-3709 TaxID=1617448 RepID=UPI0005FC4677|nr:MHYT domain-containing protein [Geminocystis sp. NIES-3709]BAQ66862.1 diguanylate cyclase/phosphodiesterase with PAS/PAC sensor [Geminocystis sp. NIES-3709]
MIDVTYDIPLVILSAIIAVGAGFFTIEMSNEIVLNKGIERWTWLIISAMTMGMGIWGMHFIAMTAFSMGMEISYDFLLVLISLLAAVIGCVQGLYIITQPLVNLKTLIAASITMGGAIAGMHYIGMAAMRVSATVNYDPIIVTLSVIIAIVVSFAAMKIVISLRQMKKNSLYSFYKIIASLIMGAAVLSMHYTGMAAAKFKIDVNSLLSQVNFLDSQVIGSSVGITVIGMFAIIYIVLLNASWNRSV